MTGARVSGHTLIDEGAAHDANGRRPYGLSRRGDGHGRCSCGALSERLPSANARKRWHRDHKAAVMSSGDGRSDRDIYFTTLTSEQALTGVRELSNILQNGGDWTPVGHDAFDAFAVEVLASFRIAVHRIALGFTEDEKRIFADSAVSVLTGVPFTKAEVRAVIADAVDGNIT